MLQEEVDRLVTDLKYVKQEFVNLKHEGQVSDTRSNKEFRGRYCPPLSIPLFALRGIMLTNSTQVLAVVIAVVLSLMLGSTAGSRWACVVAGLFWLVGSALAMRVLTPREAGNKVLSPPLPLPLSPCVRLSRGYSSNTLN